MTAISLTYKGI